MASFKTACMWEGEEGIRNNPFFQNLDRETQLGRNVIKMALK